jgi:hypothetical protein
MARACGCDLRAILAGVIICWASVEGVAVAQEGAEVTEELGNSYRLARRTSGLGSMIETLLFDGRAIVTEIAVPAQDAGTIAGTTGVVAGTPAGNATAPPGSAAALPPGIGPGFGGTLLTGEVIENYLVLHRTRASEPVTHEIFHEGRKVGSVTEVGPLTRSAKSAGRNSFAFESADDRFIVHLTQPDGTRIHATTERGRFSGQVVERSAALAAPPRSGVAAPLAPLPEPSIGRSSEPQRLVRPQEPARQIMVEEPAPQVISPVPQAAPLPRAFPLPRVRPAANLYRGTPELTSAAPVIRQKPTVKPTVTVSVPPSVGTATARAAAASSAINALAARAAASANAAPPAGPKPAAAVIATEPAALAAKPIVRASASTAPTAKPKQTLRTENARSLGGAAKPVVPVVRSSRSPPPDALGQ